MTTVLPRRGTAVMGQPSTKKLPTNIGEHRPNDVWYCKWCVFERWPCQSLRRQALAYFLRHPGQLVAFMTTWLEHARTHPEFAQATAAALHERFIGWIEPALRAQRRLEHAREAFATGARRAVRLIPAWFREQVETHLGADTLGHHFRGRR